MTCFKGFYFKFAEQIICECSATILALIGCAGQQKFGWVVGKISYYIQIISVYSQFQAI